MYAINNAKLVQNIKNTYGKKGVTWLIDLPNIIQALAAYWQLHSISSVDNMTYHYVAKVIYKDKPAVLKIGCDEKSLRVEKNALQHFHGQGSVKLLSYNNEYNALLLQQAIPGISLKTLYPQQADLVILYYASVIRKLHEKNCLPKSGYQYINHWLEAIDKASSNEIPKNLLKNAINIKNNLLATSSKQILLHGDLHHDNVLKHEDEWLSIDPKGVIGELEFEVAAFDFIHPTEIDNAVIKEIFETRVGAIAEKANLNAGRIKNWVFVRLILSTAWSIEDNTDPSWAILLANRLFN